MRLGLIPSHYREFRDKAMELAGCREADFEYQLKFFNIQLDQLLASLYGDSLDRDPGVELLLDVVEDAVDPQRALRLRATGAARQGQPKPAPVTPAVAQYLEQMRLNESPELPVMRRREAAQISACFGAEQRAPGLNDLSAAQFAACLQEIGSWNDIAPRDWVEEQALACTEPARRRALLESCLRALEAYVAASTSGGEGLARQQEVSADVQRLNSLLRQ